MNELEFSILNAISQHQRLALDFSSSYDENLFESDDAKKLARAFIEYIKTFKSRPSQKAMLDKYNTDDAFCETIEAFFEASDETEYNQDDYKYDVDRLKHKYGESRLEAIKDRLNQEGLEDVTGTIRAIEKEIGSIKAANGQKAYERRVIKNYIDDFRNLYVEKAKNPDLGRGILTGYSFFDYIKNGLRPADLVIIAGETGAGKSQFLNNMAIQTWMQGNTVDTPPDQFKKGYNVVYFSLEMPYEDCFRRSMARIADVQEYGIRDAKLSRAEAKGLSKACKFIKEYPYEFDIIDVPRGLTVQQMETMIEEIKSDYTPDVIFVDYMGLMEGPGDADDWLALGKLAGQLHEFARIHFPVVTAVQLNRIDPANKKSDIKSIGLHRIGRSSLIAHHATAILQIETRQDEESHDDFVYHFIKHRGGSLGKGHSICKNFSKCSIIDVPYDVDTMESWTSSEDISEDISDILKL